MARFTEAQKRNRRVARDHGNRARRYIDVALGWQREANDRAALEGAADTPTDWSARARMHADSWQEDAVWSAIRAGHWARRSQEADREL